jgi:hypothetical protein
MKTFKWIFVAVVLGMMVYVVMKDKPQVADISTNENVSEEIEPREICYIWNTEAGDSATLRMEFSGTGGSNVQGRFDFVPAEKDRKTGTIVGTAGPLDQQMMARTAKLWWTASGEGVTNQEELFVIFGEGIASPGFGEMKDRGDGVYVYANPENISYDLNLSQTDCGDPAVR